MPTVPLVDERDMREWKICPVCSYPLVEVQQTEVHDGRAYYVGCANGHRFVLVDDGNVVRLSSMPKRVEVITLSDYAHEEHIVLDTLTRAAEERNDEEQDIVKPMMLCEVCATRKATRRLPRGPKGAGFISVCDVCNPYESGNE